MRHLQLYRAIQAVVKEGSIRKASESLTISPSALNRQILALEEELGVPFFERLPSGVRLSIAGEVYFRTFSKHLDEISSANETIADLMGVRIGYIRLAVSRHLEAGLLSRAIAGFRKDFPKVSFRTETVDASRFSQMLAEGEADLALVTQPLFHEAVETLVTGTLPVMGIVSADEQVERVAPQDLIRRDLIVPPGRTGFRAHLDQEFRRLRLDVGPAVETEALMTPIPGVTVQPCVSIGVTDVWRAANAAQLVPLDRVKPVQVMLCKRAGRIMPLAAEKFAQGLIGALEDQFSGN